MSASTPTNSTDKNFEPDETVINHSNKVKKHIQQVIESQGGKITFADYMNLALYAPGLGYYSAGLQKFGQQGDFITAPEVSPLFSQCLAFQCIQLMQHTGNRIILEVGAGSGTMAIELTRELEQQQQLPEHYFILEVSADLRARQQAAIQSQLPHLFHHFQWLDRLPEKPFNGIILGNELLDAMPVHLLKIEKSQVNERYVSVKDDQFIWHDDQPEDSRLVKCADQIRQLHQQQSQLNPAPESAYVTEVNLQARDWIKTIAEILGTGALLLIDYGYPAREYYHPQRSMGTLMCHYRHHRHDDPFYLPGMQDITAHIDFSAIAEAAVESNLQVYGYTTQAHFLLGGGLIELSQRYDPEDIARYTNIARQIKILTMPEEMGELFKAILLGRNIPISLSGFNMQDFRHRL